MKPTRGIALLMVLLVGCAGPSGGRAALSDLADSLRSQAAEGALLARDAASGRSTRIFVREQAADLLTQAIQTRASLGAVEAVASLQPQLDRLRTAADRVTNDLDRLQTPAQDLAALAADLEGAANESRAAGEGLG